MKPIRLNQLRELSVEISVFKLDGKRVEGSLSQLRANFIPLFLPSFSSMAHPWRAETSFMEVTRLRVPTKKSAFGSLPKNSSPGLQPLKDGSTRRTRTRTLSIKLIQ